MNYDDDTVCCDSCGDDFDYSNLIDCEQGLLCGSCHEEVIRRGLEPDLDSYGDDPTVLEYDASPSNWHPTQLYKDTLFLGIELEMRFPSCVENEILQSSIKHLGNNLVWKSDGSIRGSGAELCLKPYCLKAFPRKGLRDFLKQSSIENGAVSYEYGDCGLHVHVSRAGLTSNDISKIRATMLQNRSWLIELSKRELDAMSYCKFPVDLDSYTWSERYCALNTRPRDTIEFRLWRGTLYYDRLWSCILCSHALVNFAKCHGWLACRSHYSILYFRDYIERNAQYGALSKYLNRKCYKWNEAIANALSLKPLERDFYKLRDVVELKVNL